MAKYQRDLNTGVLYLKDADVVRNYENNKQIGEIIDSLQNQINTLTTKVESLTALIQTRTTWQQAPDQT